MQNIGCSGMLTANGAQYIAPPDTQKLESKEWPTHAPLPFYIGSYTTVWVNVAWLTLSYLSQGEMHQ